MRCPSIPEDEKQRLRALREHGLQDEQLLAGLDPVVRIASRMFGMPVAAVNMVGSDHVFFAAVHGIDTADMRRDVSFCAHAINQRGVMVVADATLDERFHDNPLVTGSTNVRFYAGVPLLSPDGHAMGALCVLDSKPHQDFSAEDGERLAELARMASDRLELRRLEVHSALSAMPPEQTTPIPIAVAWLDERGRIQSWNSAAAACFGRSATECIGRVFATLFDRGATHAVRELLQSAAGLMPGDAPLSSQPMLIPGEPGAERAIGITLFAHANDGQRRIEAILSDISDVTPGEEDRLLMGIDLLTGLPNRARFYRLVEQCLLKPVSVAAVLLDLDGFKDINVSMGHAAGDAILREVGRRLEQLAGGEELAARIGGDEFALLLPRGHNEMSALQCAQQIIDRLAEPIHLPGHVVRITASCGVALAPPHAHEALELMGDADLALNRAKAAGHGQVTVFAPAMRAEVTARRLTVLELHRAADKGEFVLHYQPQMDLVTGELRGAEALMRWRHPTRGLLLPGAFLPALEAGPLAGRVGAWVIDDACAQAAYWVRQGLASFRVGVNLFDVQLTAANLVEQVKGALDRHGLEPGNLEIEITETIVLRHNDAALDSVRRLRALGVGVSFDDFGTGYASLSLLKTYPLTRIKIDRSFVRGMLDSTGDAAVVTAILDMARSFGLETIAEGVETAAQAAWLRGNGCTEAQGFLYSRALSPVDFCGRFVPVAQLPAARYC